ncbi:MAG: hypothetical protein ABIQ99_07540 [Thermoflexales bacterium]
MKKGDKPTNLDPAWWDKNKTKGFVEDPKFKTRLLFLNNHYIQYPKYDINSKDSKVMRDRVNMIRQMVAGLKETKVAIDNMLKKKTGPGAPDAPTIVALKTYLELMKKAEMERQNWIKIERGVGNTANLQEMVIGPGLDDVIPF